MAVNLSPLGGVGAQFFDNSGNPLTGGKIYTYAAGTTTPQTAYTSSTGSTPHTNPIILDAAGRVPGGEIWLTDGLQYKFVLKTSVDVLIATYDNIVGINSNFINYTSEQEIQTATAGQTVFTLTTMQYQPGTGSLSVFVDGVNQYGPGAQYAYVETDATTVTFISGLHVGASVKFTTSAINAASYGDAFQISYTPPFTGSVATNVGDKLAQWVSVIDFGAQGDGVTDDTTAFQAAIDWAQPSHSVVFIPAGEYLITDTLDVYNGTQLEGETYYQYPAGFGVPVKATTITFTPTSSKPLFDYSWDQPAPPPGFVFHTSIQGLHLKATANGSYGIKLNSVIYGLFANMSIDGFGTAIYCDATINNRFENIYCTGSSYSNVVYAGNNETTDVWEQCTFRDSDVGVRFEGASIAVRFNSCLWEVINYYGIDVHSKCQSIVVTDAYCEDVPYNTNANSCMFRVGVHTGSSLADIANHLIVTGGVFNGRSAGASGQVFKIGSSWGVIVNGIVANRYPLLFETDPVETKPNSIVVSGIEGTGWGGTIDDTSKWIGSVPNGVLNSGSFSIDGIFDRIIARNAFYNVGGATWFSNYGTPEGVVTAPVGSLYSRLDGGANTSLYVKESGSGNTGWVAK